MPSRTRRGLGEFQPLQFNPLGADLGKVVLRLLHEPAFGAASEDLGEPDGHFGRYAALAFTSSESVVRVTPSAAAAVVMVKPKVSNALTQHKSRWVGSSWARVNLPFSGIASLASRGARRMA